MFERLKSSEIVVPTGENEFEHLVERNRRKSASMSNRDFVLFPTSYCNMGCTYCGQEHVKGTLAANHRDLIARRVLRAIEAEKTESVDIRWFGAEPMMGYATILDLGGRFFPHAQRYGVAYRSAMVTNGVLLTTDKVRRMREEAGITNYIISVDGPRGIHELRRPLKSGRPSFDRILGTVAETVRVEGLSDVIFEIRTNVDELNESEVETFLEQAEQLGLAHKQVFFHCMPVHTWSEYNNVEERVMDWTRFAERELSWMVKAAELGLKSRSLPRGAKAVVCQAVTRSAEVLSATGGVFSCVAKPLVPQSEEASTLIRLADLHEDVLRPRGPYDGWHDDLLTTGKVPCSTCSIFGVCGGACPKEWEEGQIPCPSYKHPGNMQGRIHIAALVYGLHSVSNAKT